MEYVIRREGNEDYLEHYGTKGQKWGIRRFENPDGTLTEEGKKNVTGYLMVDRAILALLKSMKKV